ncbi:hypothetical protein [Kitasatospora sp. NPDC056731]|uniref:hypothetical protein n=1 Tax=Kitasatospora sp. NPDC056731 TaxID=3155422 RepID=UPI0034443B33
MEAVERPHQGRHRGAHRDPVGTALTVLWGLGHVITLALLGATADHQLSTDHPVAAPPARSLPDHDPDV